MTSLALNNRALIFLLFLHKTYLQYLLEAPAKYFFVDKNENCYADTPSYL